MYPHYKTIHPNKCYTTNNQPAFSISCSHQWSATTAQNDLDRERHLYNTCTSTSTPSSSTQSESSMCHTTSSTDSDTTYSHSDSTTFSTANDRKLCPHILINYSETLVKRIHGHWQVWIHNSASGLLKLPEAQWKSDLGTESNSESDANSLSNKTKFFFINKLFSLRVNFLKDEKCSTEQDSNLHPWHSRPSALPLDHLHYFLFSSF